jgi:hypothetical protein
MEVLSSAGEEAGVAAGGLGKVCICCPVVSTAKTLKSVSFCHQLAIEGASFMVRRSKIPPICD